MCVVEALVSTLGWKAKPPTRKQTKLNYPCILGEFLYFRGEYDSLDFLGIPFIPYN